MSQLDLIQLVIYLGIIILCVKPLGWYIAQIYTGILWGVTLRNTRFEKFIFFCCGVDPNQEMDWKQYLTAMLWFNFLGWCVTYACMRLQHVLPFNPQQFPAVSADLAFNSAASIVTNTGWQAYAGESTMSYASQIICFTVQGFISGATGIALLMAFIRGIARRETTKLGNFWVDNMRAIIYILLPIALILAIYLVSQGVIQNFKPYQTVQLIDPFTADAQHITTQTLPMGPVASLEAIKQISSSGAGFFNVNSAHPFENPTQSTNWLEMIGMLLIPAALCYTFGFLIKQRAHGWMLLAAMLIIFIPCAYFAIDAERIGNPIYTELGVREASNFEGKEMRFGIAPSAIWSVATATSGDGACNAMLDSLMPQTISVMMLLMHLGEVVFGGIGSGLYSMIFMDIVAVFIAGMMIGRTPEYLGKKIDPFEMKMICFAAIILPLLVLLGAGYACVTPIGTNSIGNPGSHGFTEILYAFSAGLFNDGSMLAGLNANTMFYNVAIGTLMLIGRYWIAICALAVAGSMARKRYKPAGISALRANNATFTILLVCVIIFMGGLTFFPTLSLGPIVEILTLWSKNIAV